MESHRTENIDVRYNNCMQNFKKYIIPCCIFFLVIVVLYLGNSIRGERVHTTDVPQNSAIASLREIWSKRIEEIGTRNAYAEFKEQTFPLDFGLQHLRAHMMGELLYEKEGIAGLAVCDASFAFGCYHSFFGRALSEHGDSVISELDAACVKQYGPLGTGCQHGIGHGIVEYTGGVDIRAALKLCVRTTQLRPYFGCTSGVFMEYNTPTIVAAASSRNSIRDLNTEDPYEPCDTTVPKEFRESCYYELASWWHSVLHGDFEKMGSLCVQITAGREREACLLGIGTIAAPLLSYDVTKTIAVCENMPDKNAQIFCRAGASWSFFAEPSMRSHTNELCSLEKKKDEQYCLLKSDLIGNREKF